MMKTVKQNAAFLLAVILAFVMCSVPAYAAEQAAYTALDSKYTRKGVSPIHTDGTWNYDGATDTWMYSDGELLKNTWAYIVNPWNDNKPAWFIFDENGKMLTGWKLIFYNGSYKFFYFHEASDGCRGECQLGGITPDGYTVDETGAWTVNGVVQEYSLQRGPVLAGSSGSQGSSDSGILINISDSGVVENYDPAFPCKPIWASDLGAINDPLSKANKSREEYLNDALNRTRGANKTWQSIHKAVYDLD